MDEMVSRIRQIIDWQKLSDRAFAIKCNIGPTTLDMQTKGKRSVSLDTVRLILSTFDDISAEWLVRGTGGMFKVECAQQELERIAKLVDTIETLQGVINDKNGTIAALNEKITQLENKLK